MGLIEVNWRPGPRQLRQFAAAGLVGFGALGLIFAWKLGALTGSGRWTLPVVLWAAGAALAALGAVAPAAVRPVYVALTALALPVGWVVAHLVMAMLYYGLFTAVALVFRLVGRDPLHRRFEPEAESYWTERPPPAPPARYFRQF